MRVLVTGATGLVGRALTLRLQRDGHQVVAMSRDLTRASFVLGPEVELLATGCSSDELAAAMRHVDAVVNLAGDPLFSGRWDAAKKRRMVESRVGLTARLVRAMEASGAPPSVLVSASAVGIYGDAGERDCPEDAAPAADYLGRLAQDWEAAARGAERLGVRVVLPRIGIVLDLSGGALLKMLPVFLTGGGGPLGSGRQWMSWVHLDDLLEMILTALHERRWSGAFNAVAPTPVRNAAFSSALGAALGRPAFLPAPSFAVRLALGEAAEVVLGGQRVLPERLREWGVQLAHPVLSEALGHLLAPRDAIRIGAAEAPPDSAYLRARGAAYHLAARTLVRGDPGELRSFFRDGRSLGPLTPGFISMEPVGESASGPIRAGDTLEYRVRVGPTPVAMPWLTLIEEVHDDGGFVDSAPRSPYASWWHVHTFQDVEGGVEVRDDAYYSPPLGPLGRLTHPLSVAPILRTVFACRAHALGRRFGLLPARASGAEATPLAATT
jgi:uncharacterized protein (TIGR01777 family)